MFQSNLRAGPLVVLGVALYACGAFPVAWAFRTTDFALVFVIWESLSVITALIISLLIFGEPITRTTLFSAALAIGALIPAGR